MTRVVRDAMARVVCDTMTSVSRDTITETSSVATYGPSAATGITLTPSGRTYPNPRSTIQRPRRRFFNVGTNGFSV